MVKFYLSSSLVLIFNMVIPFSGRSILAQDWNKFEGLFIQDTTQKVKDTSNCAFKNISTLSYYPDTLPGWFFSPPVLYQGAAGLGISDPDMPMEKAREQAYLRAKSMALLNYNARVQYYRDIYSSANEVGRYTNLRQRFDTYFKISSLATVSNAMFEVVDTHFTRYNEYVVLLSYNPGIHSDDSLYKLTSVGSAFLVEATFDDVVDEQAEYELLCNATFGEDSAASSHFLFREKGKRFLTSSFMNNAEVGYPMFPYSYVSPQDSARQHPFISYSGLWSSYLRQLVNYLTLNAQQSSIKLKSMDDQYSTKLTNLSREIASFRASLNINGIKFANDTLKLDLQLNEVESNF
ncbi:MAG TPA: hypothetical protein PKN78_02675 [Tenuifilaceae bacterium]|nr:hypothetical protein [Tenuifilaceae bacterium]